MQRFRLIAVTLLLGAGLAACNTPGPGFRGHDPVRVRVQGSIFDVRVAANRAEAIRRNPEWTLRRETVAPRAVVAIEAVSGCRVAHLGGDQAVIRARLECGPGPPSSPSVVPLGQVCDGRIHDDGHVVLYCDPAV